MVVAVDGHTQTYTHTHNKNIETNKWHVPSASIPLILWSSCNLINQFNPSNWQGCKVHTFNREGWVCSLTTACRCSACNADFIQSSSSSALVKRCCCDWDDFPLALEEDNDDFLEVVWCWEVHCWHSHSSLDGLNVSPNETRCYDPYSEHHSNCDCGGGVPYHSLSSRK